MGAQIPQEWDNQVVLKTKYATGWRGGGVEFEYTLHVKGEPVQGSGHWKRKEKSIKQRHHRNSIQIHQAF